jgi:serine/threonine-protein kinase
MQNPAIKRFGRYEVVAELGRGAMGVVYKARDPQIDRLVAVKTVSMRGQTQEEEKEFLRRFMNEAQAVGRLHHAGIVSIFDVGEHDIDGDPGNCEPYIVLEYVPGEALNRILAREKKLQLAKALQIAEEIAEALDYAHAQGVIHRDIKPGNILVTEDGHPKIADFGIAKMNLAHFTVPGRVLGTPAYMAPEQLSGEGVDARSDLFSLGVILYVMTTGQSPFHGDSATTVCFKVANREPVAASALDLNLPPELDHVISRAMAKDPDQRYQRGAEFAEDLRQLQAEFGPQSISDSTKSGSTKAGTTKSGLTKSGWTTTSFSPAASSGSRALRLRTGKTAPQDTPAAAIQQARKAVRTVLAKAPIRDLILGAAVLVILVVVGAQLRLLNSSRGTEANLSTATSAPPPTTNFDNAPPSAAASQPAAQQKPAPPPRVAQQKPAPPARVTPKVRAASRPTPKQVIIASSTLDLAVQHQFVDATLYLWVDDKLALTRPLHGGTQKRLVVFNGIRGVDSETITIPAGEHVLRVRALSADRTIDLSRTVSAVFVGGDGKSLQVTFDKHNTLMRLTWQ